MLITFFMLKGTMSMLFITEMAVLATISNMKAPSSLYPAQNSGEIPFPQAVSFYRCFWFFLHTFYMNEFVKLYQLATSVKVIF